MKDRVVTDIGTKEHELKWEYQDWSLIYKRVRNLRRRIYRNTQQKKWNQVRSLMKLMLRSQANLLLSISRVTEINKGRKTAGIDGQKVLTNPGREKLYKEMSTFSPWKAKPVKRVLIPKFNGNKRPLGIPVIKDRIMQSMVKNALEPSWETRFEWNNYGFRPGRSTHDAIDQCHRRLMKGMDKWVLDADIKGAFDNISHDFLINKMGNIPGLELIKQWLKAGYVENEVFNPTYSGTPQGGIISPLLANIALDGLGEFLSVYVKVKEYKSSPKAKRQRIIKQKLPRFGFCRYADDFIVTAESKEDLKNLLPDIKRWLSKRGLQFNLEKTKIINCDEGFNFLGFNIRQYNGHCITKPEKAKTLNFLQRIRDWLKKHKDVTAEAVINYLNPVLKGWGNYYRFGASKNVFGYVDHEIWKTLWLWAKRRHKNKGKRWIARKYFNKDWRFKAEITNRRGDKQSITLTKLYDIPITRHIQVKGNNSPDDPTLIQYWEDRRTSYGKVLLAKGSRLHKIVTNQKWKCPYCKEHLYNGKELHQHHIKQIKDGGYEFEDNLQLMHKFCHTKLHAAQGA